MILPEVLALLKTQVDKSFDLHKLRKSIIEKDGASVDHSGVFDGAQRKCVKIPRRYVDINVVKLIDKGIDKKYACKCIYSVSSFFSLNVSEHLRF